MDYEGRLLELSRKIKYNKNKRWTIEYLLSKEKTYIKEKDLLISKKTYRKLSKGFTIQNKDIIFVLCRKLQIVYQPYEQLPEPTFDTLYFLFIKGNTFGFEELLEVLLFNLECKEGYFYYDQYLYLVRIIK